MPNVKAGWDGVYGPYTIHIANVTLNLTLKSLKYFHFISNLSTDLKGEHHCNVCSKTFEKSDQLATHTECHATKEKQDSENVKPPSREIECSTCQQSLKSEAALRRHMVSHKVTKCTECLESFEDRVAFFAHIASYHADLYPYQCHKPQCGESFKTDLQVAYHLVVHMDSKTDTLFQCNMCLKEFVRKGTLQTHIKTHEGARVKPHECHICLKRFMFHSEMVVHKRCHTGERPFQCKICGQSFTQKGNLSQHQMKHTDSRPFICQVEDCKKSYKYFGDLQSHQRDKHPAENDLVAPTKMNMSELTKKTTTTCKVCGNEKKSDVEHLCLPVGVEDVKPFTCKKCRKSFAKNHELQKHIQQSHMKDLFQCNHCRVTFVTEMLLQEHELASHPSYKCPTCDQAFRSEKECNKHGQIHLLNGDSYHCSACTLVFAGASNLKMHEAREHGLSPFRCKVCVEGFQRASQLKEHEQVHLKDSPHQCVHCFERFLTDADVVTHVLTHMEEMAHVCGKCGEGFKLAKDLKKHQCPAANGDLQLDCTLCDESFDEYRKLEMHIEKAHFAPPKQDNVKSGANRCRVCKRKFESEEEFQIHIVFVHPDSEPQKKRIRSVTKPSPKQGNSSGTTKSSHHKSGHSSGAKKSSQKPAQSPSAKSSQNLIRRTSSGRISTKPRKLRDSDDEEQNSATSPSSSSSSPSLSSARSKSSSSSPSLSSARSKRDLTRKPVVIKTDSPAKREAKRQPGEGWKRLRRMSAADVAEEVTRESPKKRKAADSPGTTTRRGSSPRIAAASNHNAANKNTANKPFKCRHCSMRFVSASKKLGHEKSH